MFNARHQAHLAFDPIWKLGHKKRSGAYLWLAYKLGIPVEDCHISRFDVATCERVIAESASWFARHPNKRRKDVPCERRSQQLGSSGQG